MFLCVMRTHAAEPRASVLALTCLHSFGCTDCGMNCHKLCKDQVAFECKKNAKGACASDSPTPTLTPVTAGVPEGRWSGVAVVGNTTDTQTNATTQNKESDSSVPC